MRAFTGGPTFRAVAEESRGGFHSNLDFSFNPRHCSSSYAGRLLVRTRLSLHSS